MHIEPGVVDGAKLALSYGTAAVCAALSLKLAVQELAHRKLPAVAISSVLATVAVLFFFEMLPHVSAGISEVHFILGTTLFLLFGALPAALGLAFGLLLQGAVFAPSDLPMYFVNVTTLLAPLFVLHAAVRRLVSSETAYTDLSYSQVLSMSLIYQGGVVAWVAFWAVLGQGYGLENLTAILSFGSAYILVLVFEPFVELAVLAVAKAGRDWKYSHVFTDRLYSVA